jgi:hypothetical protein
MARSTKIKASNDQSDLEIYQHDSDMPNIPVSQIEKLHQLDPKLVDWFINETNMEATHRRTQESRVNGFIFIGKIVGQICGFLMGVGGIIGGAYTAIKGQPEAGGAIAVAAISGLAYAFVTGQKKKS